MKDANLVQLHRHMMNYEVNAQVERLIGLEDNVYPGLRERLRERVRLVVQRSIDNGVAYHFPD